MNTDGFAHYLPGDQVAVVLGATAILLPGSPGDAMSAECFAALTSDGVEAVIDALFARGLRAAPDFAICEVGASGRTRALTRGRGRVEIETARERHVLDEGRLVADHEYLDVVIATLSLAPGLATPDVPVQGGVVAAAAVSLTPVIAASLRHQGGVSDAQSLAPVDAPKTLDAAGIESDRAAGSAPDDGAAAEADAPADSAGGPEIADESASDPGSESPDQAPAATDLWGEPSDHAGPAALEADVWSHPIDLSKPTSRAGAVGESASGEPSSGIPSSDPLARAADEPEGPPFVDEPPAPIGPVDAVDISDPADEVKPDEAVDPVEWAWGSPSAPADNDGGDVDGSADAVPSWNPADWRVTPVRSDGSAEPVDIFDNQPSFSFPPPPGPAGLQGPDPDGDMELTIARSDLMAALGAPAAAPSGPLVLAKRCAQGHFTVAFQQACRVCHGPVPEQEAVEISRPPLGILRLESGEVITVDRDIVLGRSPREIPGQQGERPHLARIVDPQHEVSGQHALVSVNYWLVSVTDLGSTNGTSVVDAHGVTTALTPDTPVVIEPGSTIVLGEVSRISFEATA